MKALLTATAMLLACSIAAQNKLFINTKTELQNNLPASIQLPQTNSQFSIGKTSLSNGNEKTINLFDTIPDFGLPTTTLQDEQVDPGNFAIQIDQDFLFRFPHSNNEDRNYTQGTAFTYSHPKLINSIFLFPLKLLAYNRIDPAKKKPYSSSIAIGATAFTPRKIDSINPVIGDRPFSFLFYVSTSATYSTSKNIIRNNSNGRRSAIDIYHTYTINYGMFGTRLGYEFQSFAHKNIVKGRPTDPKGWNHQISAGGRPTILVEYNRFRPLLSIAADKTEQPVVKRIFDVGWNFGGSIGYYDRIFTGLYARVGLLKAYNQARWNGGWSSLTGASYQKLKAKKERILKPEVFLYGRFNTTIMLRNSMLVGQRYFKSEYTLDPSWVKTFLYEYEWGVVAAVERQRKGERSPRTWAVVFRTMYRSPEFDSKIYPVRWHYFGSVGILVPVF